MFNTESNMNVVVMRTFTGIYVASEFPYSLNVHSTESPKMCLSRTQFQASAAM